MNYSQLLEEQATVALQVYVVIGSGDCRGYMLKP